MSKIIYLKDYILIEIFKKFIWDRIFPILVFVEELKVIYYVLYMHDGKLVPLAHSFGIIWF